MNRTEALQVVGLVAAAWPAWKASDATVELWVVELADLPHDPAVAAVRTLIATDDGWPSIAKVRREVARLSGVLAPDLDRAWSEVLSAAGRFGRHSRPAWSHPAIGQAVDGVGWTAICNSTNLDVVRGQFARVYQTVAERAHRAAVRPGGGIGLPVGEPRKALP